MSKPSIVILSTFLSPFRSGAEACAEEIAMRLAEDYEVTIVTAKLTRSAPRFSFFVFRPQNEPFDQAQDKQRTTNNEKQNAVKIVRIGLGTKFDKWLYPFLAPFAARRLKPDLIHAILETFAGLALHFSALLVPSAKRLLPLQTTNRMFLRTTILHSPHVVTAISDALAKDAARRGRDDVMVIPNGVDVQAIEEATRKNIHGTKVPGRILFVGRLEEMKGVDTLLQVFSVVSGKFPCAHLRIVGDGSLRSELQATSYPFDKLRAGKLQAADRVTFVGHVPPPAVYEEFAQAEIFCGLSRSEALGNVFLEAQAAGCAVIATRVGGIPEIVQDGVTGILVPPDDIQAARGALGRLLKDAPFRELLAAQGREHARKYDWGVIAGRYAEVYYALLHNGGTHS